MVPITQEFQDDVAATVRANAGDPATAARYLNELVEVQVITPEASQAIWDEVMGEPAQDGEMPGLE